MSAAAGPRRYIVPGHHVDGRTMFNTLQTVTGRRLRHVVLPAQAMLPFTWGLPPPSGRCRSICRPSTRAFCFTPTTRDAMISPTREEFGV